MTSASARADYDVVVIGAGAAGLAAGRCLAGTGIKFRILEARSRIGGRAWTLASAFPLDLGCGWLHSADINPWTSILSERGFTIDKTPPAWGQHSLDLGFDAEQQRSFDSAISTFRKSLTKAARRAPDQAAAELLEPNGRFNSLIEAVTSYASGTALDCLSIHDTANYHDTGINWRVVEGYGAGIADFGRDLPVTLACPVARLDHGSSPMRLTTPQGVITADKVIITLPTNLLAREALVFDPPLPEKCAAAEVLPLGIADKLILGIDRPMNLPKDGHLFGRTDHADTASYHLRPFGRNLIEAYFGGQLATDLESEGPEEFYSFAVDELADLLGNSIRARLRPVAETAWGRDPFARGSYSYALPGHADARAKLAEPVDERIFFAGEACSKKAFSTAHGAYLTGIAAAEAVLAISSASKHPLTAR